MMMMLVPFPVFWAPPEVLSDKKFTVKSDVWSYGILLHEMFTYGRTPYEGIRLYLSLPLRNTNTYGRSTENIVIESFKKHRPLFATLTSCEC